MDDVIERTLYSFLHEEAKYRLKRIFDIPEKAVSDDLIYKIADALIADPFIFNYSLIDEIIAEVLRRNGIDTENV